MPKRKVNKNNNNKRRGKTKPAKSTPTNNDSSNGEHKQQSHSDIASLLQSKIALMEDAKIREENAALFKTNVIRQQMSQMQAEYESHSQPLEAHLSALYSFIGRINDVFYSVSSSEQQHKALSDRLTTQNAALSKLCKQQQLEIKQRELKETQWRAEMEGKFEDSLSSIRDKIAEHESRYSAVVDENGKLRAQLQQFLEYDKKRSADFTLYKEHQGKLDEIVGQEKENLTALLEQESAKTRKLQTNLGESLKINDLLSSRCKEYEAKFGDMASTVKESSKCIEEYKKMNVELMKQNKAMHAKLTDVMSKYKLLNGYNDQLDAEKRRMSKRMETLSELARKMQNKNKDLSDDLKQAKTHLFNAGAVDLVWKSDPKPKEEVPAEAEAASEAAATGTEDVAATETETVAAAVTDDAESEKVCDEEEDEENEAQQQEPKAEQSANNPNDQAATF